MSALEEYDYIVVIDTSSSMGEPYKGSTRWLTMQESVTGLVRDIEKLDSDGIDVVQLGAALQSWKNVTTQNVRDMFASLNPRGSTPLAEALTKALALGGTSSKKRFVIVFTDGMPDDQAAAAKVITQQANKQVDDDECTILFVQVGDDRAATAYLKGLDDNLKGAKFDIVDAMTIEEAEKFASVQDMILKAIND